MTAQATVPICGGWCEDVYKDSCLELEEDISFYLKFLELPEVKLAFLIMWLVLLSHLSVLLKSKKASLRRRHSSQWLLPGDRQQFWRMRLILSSSSAAAVTCPRTLWNTNHDVCAVSGLLTRCIFNVCLLIYHLPDSPLIVFLIAASTLLFQRGEGKHY